MAQKKKRSARRPRSVPDRPPAPADPVSAPTRRPWFPGLRLIQFIHAAATPIPGHRNSVPWRIFRFLASLGLAITLLLSLALVLGAATFYESAYGTAGVQARVYQAWWFPVLLGALAVNIFCAAAIRYPWKRYQTGFVITHGGLLVILLGCWVTLHHTVDGTVVMTEGGPASSTILLRQNAIRLTSMRPIPGSEDVRKRDTTVPIDLDAIGYPSFARYIARTPFTLIQMAADSLFEDGRPRWLNAVFSAMDAVLTPSHDGFQWPKGTVVEKDVDDPAFQQVRVEVLQYLASCRVVDRYNPARDQGFPALDFSLSGKPPMVAGADDMEMLSGWLYQDTLQDTRKEAFQGLADAVLWSARHPDEVREFLKPPLEGMGPKGKVAIYAGDRTFYVDVAANLGKTVTLDDGRTRVEVVAQDDHGIPGARHDPLERSNPVVALTITTAEGSRQQHVAFATQPFFPTGLDELQDFLHSGPGRSPDGGRLSVCYFHPAAFGPQPEGRWGSLQFLQGPDGRLYYRLLGLKGLEGSGRVTVGHEVRLQDRNLKRFVVHRYVPHAVHDLVYEPYELPRDQRDKAVPAARLRVTADGTSNEVWLMRGEGSKDVLSGSGRRLRVAFDQTSVPMDYRLKLKKFQLDHDPGTDKASNYTSYVELKDPARGIDQDHVITMNEPLTYGGQTLPLPLVPSLYRPNIGGTSFYQASFNPPEASGGRYMSILSVMYDPGRPFKYIGSLMLILGISTMFWMKAYFFKPRHGGQVARQVMARRRPQAGANGNGAAAPTIPAVAGAKR